jgi:hypothetical protein
VLIEAKGVPARFVFVKPATAARDDERRVASLPSPQQLYIARVGSQNIITQQVVGNNVHELTKGGSSCEV